MIKQLPARQITVKLILNFFSHFLCRHRAKIRILKDGYNNTNHHCIGKWENEIAFNLNIKWLVLDIAKSTFLVMKGLTMLQFLFILSLDTRWLRHQLWYEMCQVHIPTQPMVGTSIIDMLT